jgi:hypothetical protein
LDSCWRFKKNAGAKNEGMFHDVIENKTGKIAVLGLSKMLMKIKKLEGSFQDLDDK